ncbi:TIGR03364 family FAD-dependent oxidoreductase [Fibrella aquatilis]|uniref:TIGR03364 family FAD-dependent oxidoreductase n=1 Tax=Fibrella aquatilis TaxID=2817059 RepID=A0A939JXS0_9BACT|nr:TIGR03364 family FAD-dependent oxidoreductase [Fibrella aquatilis]MBO0929603.1 TIGR03364 family FAD-dependent oxidoreductase [Fibrella aquatilis]
MYDLIIVGAGILGATHAYHAAQRGLKVLLLEKDNHPVSSTVRNFGQIVPSGMAGRWFEYGRRTLELYRQWQAETDLSLRQNGSIYVASDDDEWQLANELFDRRRAENYPCELLTATQTLAKYPTLRPDYIRGALWFPDEMSAEPDQFIHRFIDFIVRKHGVTYRPNAAVVDCLSNYGGAIVTLAGGERLSASRVLICGGYEFRLLYPDVFANSGLVVSKLQMLQTVPMPAVSLPGNILTGLTIRRYESFTECPSFASIQTPPHLAELKKWGVHILFKQATDGSIIIGDSHEYASAARIDDLGYDTKDALNHLMLTEARRIVQFPVDHIARTWAGYYAQTASADRANEIFEHDVDDYIRIVTGIGGKGMSSGAGYAEASLGAWMG